jgi:hypothetical protein
MASSRVDGNAIRGLLSEILAVEPENAVTVCYTCGDKAQLGQSLVYQHQLSTEVHCSFCNDTLFTIVHAGPARALVFNALRLLKTC